MKCHKAYKFRIYPSKEQKILLEKTFGCVRFIYNRMLSDKISYYEETGKMLKNTPAQYKKEYDWLKEVDSLALANAQLHLETAYKQFFKKPKIGFPKYKSKHRNKKTYTTNYVNGNIKFEEGYLILPKLKKIKIKQHRDIPSEYRIKSVTVEKKASGRYYVSILCEYEKEIVRKKTESFIGMDYSMGKLYITSENTKAEYPQYYKESLDKLQKEQRKLSRMKKGGRNRFKQRVRLAKLHEKIANQRKDFLHKTARQIANVYDCVCMEDLDMKEMSQIMDFGRSIHDNGWGIFTKLLEYKLEEQGKQLIKIDKWYPSSQICHVCGYKNEQLKDISIRRWECPKCHAKHDRDYNASINILKEGMRLALQ